MKEKKVSTWIGLVIIFLLSFSVGLIIYQNYIWREWGEVAVSFSEEEGFENRVELWPGVGWSQSKIVEKEQALYYDGSFLEGPDADFSGSVDLKGREWSGTFETDSSEEAGGKIESFQDYYRGKLEESGWESQCWFKNVRMMPVSADGPGGSIWGYVKSRKDEVQVVLLSYKIIGEAAQREGPVAIDVEGVEFKVFISEAVPILDYLPEDASPKVD